jgi:hypothetical protein
LSDPSTAPDRLYTVRKAPGHLRPQGPSGTAVWSHAHTLGIDSFRPESSDHRPRVTARALYDEVALYIRFDVHDQFVRCVHTTYGDPVYTDSCVEVFLQPRTPGGYINLEVNCGGALLSSFIEDPRIVPGGFARCQPILREHASIIAIAGSLPPVVDPEISSECDWWIEMFVPFTFFERYVGEAPPLPGDRWRANFYKCGDGTSHPHWASWCPVGELNFHRPNDFGTIVFEP